ncbi:WGR domain-containing protein [Bacteroides sp. 224]|uniref:WGR domain-containing protein n=1 Tax=Bacteroides sp. 224 TaxID=2302936 RepID=UPI0013D612BD|nr:WGR domain-containing protein [Bacteroides sp. 224]NDV66657.1 hypothetical protein [Bacteroides sp. 224]
MKHYKYTDYASEKRCEVSLSDNKLSTNTINSKGKSTLREKEFDNPEEAAKQFEKKGWELLKKGFVLLNEEVTAGTPYLHYFTSTGYSGCLSFAKTPEGIYVYKHGWYNTAEDQADFMVRINERGELLETIRLPKVLPWETAYNAANNALWMNLDHHIYTYNLHEKAFIPKTTEQKKPASFLSLSEKYIAYGSHPILRVEDHQGNILWENRFDVHTIKGSIPFYAALSQQGDILAFHNKPGEIELLDPLTGDCRQIITNDIRDIKQMQFVEDDRVLMVCERYGSWSTHFFDVATGAKLDYPELAIPEYSTQVDCFCFNADQSILVQTQRHRAYVYNFKERKFLYSFALEHCVKTAHVQFVGDMLGVRTDYGCFSLYHL